MTTKYNGFIGKVLDNKYRILDVVGSGGMAVVLKAEDINMKRLVAIKILNDEYNGNETAEKRFANEAKAVAMLSQENIVSIYDIAMYPDMKYIVMEFLDGISLREYLDNKGALSWKEACIYVLQILRALEHAHSKGIIHRDIKPQNVMLLKTGEIKVTDFGIAKTPSNDTLTTTQKAIGTVYYISPEQACGRPTGYASDLYSLGIMLFEAVTGTLPFTGDNSVQIAMQQVNNDPPDPRSLVPSLPVGVKQIILKAMQKDPANRFSSAHSMAKAIEWLIRHPDATFADGNEPSDASSAASATAANTAVAVSIDMIDTSQIERIGNTEIVESLYGHKPKKERQSKEKKPKKEKKAKNKQSRSMFPIISGVTFAALIVAMVIGVLAVLQVLTGVFSADDSITATYPDIVGMAWNTQLESQLMNGNFGGVGFKVDHRNIIYVENDKYTVGQITATEPSALTVKKKSSTDADRYFYFDSITVCGKGKELVMPDVTYFQTNIARVALQNNYGLTVDNIVYIDSNDFNEDQVVKTEPVAGTTITNDTKITLYVCRHSTNYPSTLKLPDLVGYTEQEATALAKYALYDVQIEYKVSRTDKAGTVIAQSIPANTISPANTPVVLTVAQEDNGVPVGNYVGMTYADVMQLLAEKGLAVDPASRFYYVESGSNSAVYSMLYGKDFENAKTQMMLGYEAAPEDENAIVLYQSALPNSSVQFGGSIGFIFGTDPFGNGGETSGDESDGDVSSPAEESGEDSADQPEP